MEEVILNMNESGEHKNNSKKDFEVVSPISSAATGGSYAESQLGKGVIKPQIIEFSVDGVHFKYDEPLCNKSQNTEKMKEKKQDNIRLNEMKINEESRQAEKLDGHHGEAEINKDIELVQQEAECRPQEQELQIEKDSEEVTLAIPQEAQETEERADNELATEESVSNSENQGEINKEIAVLWEGRKLPLGPRYSITNQAVVIEKTATEAVVVDLEQIVDLKMTQNFLEKALNIGNVALSLKNYATSQIILERIVEPEHVKKLLAERVEINN